MLVNRILRFISKIFLWFLSKTFLWFPSRILGLIIPPMTNIDFAVAQNGKISLANKKSNRTSFYCDFYLALVVVTGTYAIISVRFCILILSSLLRSILFSSFCMLSSAGHFWPILPVLTEIRDYVSLEMCNYTFPIETDLIEQEGVIIWFLEIETVSSKRNSLVFVSRKNIFIGIINHRLFSVVPVSSWYSCQY